MREQKKARLINVLMRDGTPKRVPMDRAEDLLSRGEAKRYISHTVYRALRNGIEVKNLSTLDTDGKLKALIQAAEETTKVKATKVKAAASDSEGSEERIGPDTRQKRRRRRRSETTA